MYNVALSIAAGAAVLLLTSLWLGAIPAVIPALLVTGLCMFLLSRRTGRLVEAEMQQLVPLMQNRQIPEAQAKLAEIKKKYGKWQILLDGQMDAQLGMIDYLQLKFDEALPKLESGQFRNWTAQACIGCIHYRRKRKDEAFEALSKAATTDPKQLILYLVWATLLVRDGKRAEALQAVDQGLQALPDQNTLKALHKTIANKKKINTKHFPQTWYQFWPEELAQQMVMRGRKGPPPPGAPQMPQQPRFGASRAPRR